MSFNNRFKSTAVVAAAVLVFGIALPLVSNGTMTGAVGNKSKVTKTTVAKKGAPKVTITVVKFPAKSATLTPAGKLELTSLAKVITGQKVTITGFAKGNEKLATKRDAAVVNYLKSKVKFTPTVQQDIATSLNQVEVRWVKAT
ncbi:MAG TPA: hypothetical protein VNF08_08740 [Acidimicrobiales bacterium]|nr:hypothetical protein [Acidimicrobiales bacterium]